MHPIDGLLSSIPKKKKKETKLYKKPQSVKDFEVLYNASKNSSLPMNARVYDKFSDNKANDLQKLIVKFFEFHGGFATRINSTGIYRADLKKFVRNTQKKGLGDVQIVYNGKTIYLEVKIGKDKPSDVQLTRQEQIRKAGGIYEFIHNFDEVLMIFNSL